MPTSITKPEQGDMPVQVDLPKWLWKAIKVKAAEREVFAKDLVAEALMGHFKIKQPSVGRAE